VNVPSKYGHRKDPVSVDFLKGGKMSTLSMAFAVLSAQCNVIVAVYKHNYLLFKGKKDNLVSSDNSWEDLKHRVMSEND